MRLFTSPWRHHSPSHQTQHVLVRQPASGGLLTGCEPAQSSWTLTLTSNAQYARGREVSYEHRQKQSDKSRMEDVQQETGLVTSESKCKTIKVGDCSTKGIKQHTVFRNVTITTA